MFLMSDGGLIALVVALAAIVLFAIIKYCYFKIIVMILIFIFIIIVTKNNMKLI